MGDVEDVTNDLERSNAAAAQLDKKQRNFDKLMSDQKMRENELQSDLEMAQKEGRGLSTELFKMKNAYEEALDALETIKRENKNIQEELADMSDQLGESAKATHELEKAKRALEVDRNDVQGTFECFIALIKLRKYRYINI